ncbi:MAG: cell division protein FtsA [Deinococcus sp.]|nr:cell division protein FtsA [Deinococcus sp.]
MSTGRLVVGLDIGTTKICTVIAEADASEGLRIVGEGTVPSHGVKRGMVVDIEQTAQAVAQSLEAAERVAGVEITSAWVGVAGSHIRARLRQGTVPVRRREVGPEDMQRALDAATSVDPAMELIHRLPLEYTVDGQDGISAPSGMSGSKLAVDLLVVSGATGALANLRKVVSDNGLVVQGLALQALASGNAVLTPTEREVTTILIDIGGGTTDVGVFRRGQLAHAAVIPLGGDHVTSDIAQILKLPPPEAEALKLRHGAAIPALAQGEFTVQGERLSAWELSEIVAPRMREIFDLARRELEKLGPVELLAHSLVLTGGGAMLRGTVELARERFRLPTRLGAPQELAGLSDVVSSPAHATAVGLARFGSRQPLVRERPAPLLNWLKRVMHDTF